MLTRHRSLTEASQSLRQIHIPKKTSRVGRPPLLSHGFLFLPSYLFSLAVSSPNQKSLSLSLTFCLLQFKSKDQVSPEKPAAVKPQKQEVQGV